MSRFGNLKETPATIAPPASAPASERASASKGTQANRVSKKMISGYFSPAMSTAMRMTALSRSITLQQAMVEAFDLWLRENGASPIGD